MTKSKLIDIYYDLFDYLPEIDMFAEALKKICKCKHRKSLIINSLEELRLHHVEEELALLDTLSKEVLNNFNVQYQIRRSEVRVLYKAGENISVISKITDVPNGDIKKMIKEEKLKIGTKGFYQTTLEDYKR